jgi:hypothetical protein
MLETPGRIEPCFFEERIPVELADLSVEIQRDATRLGQGLHPDSAAELADLVRVMNCYYSNLSRVTTHGRAISNVPSPVPNLKKKPVPSP